MENAEVWDFILLRKISITYLIYNTNIKKDRKVKIVHEVSSD